MNVFIDNRTEHLFPSEYIKIIQDVVKESIAYCKASPEWEVSISIVESDEIRRINKKFRNIDKITDVLSFPLHEPDSSYNINDSCLGDIIICLERVFLQAEEYGHSPEREIGFLAAHGTLHLLGFDHMEADEEKLMLEKQESILKSIGLIR